MIAIAVALALTWPSAPPAAAGPASTGADRWRWEGHRGAHGFRATQAGHGVRWS